MYYVALWIDHDEAKIFNFKQETPDVFLMTNSHHIDHHANHHFENKKKEQLRKFYQEVHKQVLNAKGILILGPGLAKKEFAAYIESHHPDDLGKRILGVETLDKASDSEIKDFSKHFFHKINLFTSEV